MAKFVAVIIGAFVGWTIFGNMHPWLSFPGLLIGATIGNTFSAGFSSFQRSYTTEEKRAMETVFFKALFPILGCIAKADGRVCEQEIQTIEQVFDKMQLGSQTRKDAIALFNAGTDTSFEPESVLDDFITTAKDNIDLKHIFLAYLISLALADGNLHDAEDEILGRVAQKLGYSRFSYMRLLGMIQAQRQFYQGQHENTGYRSRGGPSRGQTGDELNLAYKALGVEKSASDKEVKLAWRRLMSANHPDKLSGKGVPEDMIKLATERSQEIQLAYDLIKKNRGT